jgi:hypothetical protein
MLPRLSRIVLVSFVWTLSAGPLRAEAPIPPKDLPEAVVKAIGTKFPGSTVTAATRDERNDYVYFTVTIREQQTDRQIRLKEDGEFVP